MRWQTWMWPDHWIYVAFDKHGLVIGYYLFEPMGPSLERPPSFSERICEWLGIEQTGP